MKTFSFAAIMALALTLASAAPVVAQPNTNAVLEVPVVGTVPGGGATFNGLFTLQRFVVSGDGVAAVGRLVGTATSAAGETIAIARTVSLPILANATNATCDILHLELGPLDLNLLGLQIDLSKIVLDITAQSGAGNLLGNLLCNVAGLLDNPSGLARLLNRILSVVGG